MYFISILCLQCIPENDMHRLLPEPDTPEATGNLVRIAPHRRFSERNKQLPQVQNTGAEVRAV
jgi:hypothetical protein